MTVAATPAITTPDSLTVCFAEQGTPVVARTGQPLLLEGSDQVWQVVAGEVDLFLTRLVGGQPRGALHAVSRVGPSQLLLGLPKDRLQTEWGIIAVASVVGGVDGTAPLLRLPRRALVEAHSEIRAALTKQCECWMASLQAPLIQASPSEHREPIHGEVRRAQLDNGENLRHPEQDYWPAIDAFNLDLLAALTERCLVSEANAEERLQRKAQSEQRRLAAAVGRLSDIVRSGAEQKSIAIGDNSLLAVCQIIGNATGIAFCAPNGGEEALGVDPLLEIVEASHVRQRRIGLRGDWWLHEGPALLAFYKTTGQAVALLPSPRGYRLHDPITGSTRAIDAELANALAADAHMFYRAFGASLLKVVELLRFGLHGCLPDAAMVVVMGVVIGLLGMVIPMATGLLFDSVIPGADKTQLLQLSLALLVGAMATSLFEITKSFATLRAEGRMDASVQSAVWDRLLRLPTRFFRDYTAGDLALRANSITTIRQALSGQTLHTLLAAVFSSFNLALLFYYNVKLALLGLVLVAVAIFANVGFSFWRLHHERHLAASEGYISGMVLQFLGGISKLRTAGAETRAFCNWAQAFATQQEHAFAAGRVKSVMGVFNAVFPTLCNICIYMLVVYHLGNDRNLSTGAFLAFNTAFGGFLSAMLSASSALTGVLDIIPVYERAKPILESSPEISEQRAHPGPLHGLVEINHVSFRYTPDGPTVLKDINLNIRPGEFVAIVGASGSGKSTLLRLLLGFERPSMGAIYYDQKDLASLDLGGVRRQLGVVLQNGQLLSGDLFTNIVGSAPLTLDAAWRAAEEAGIAADIRDMPMGMHTVVSDGGSTLSGGQRQRLMIARAIVNRPRILFFDEATSALDNRAQAMVSTSLEQLRSTRVVIAHRLSTIANADHIVVMEGGSIVQAGTYDELIATEGLFSQLASRQVI